MKTVRFYCGVGTEILILSSNVKGRVKLIYKTEIRHASLNQPVPYSS
jgi:hypothetical protein